MNWNWEKIHEESRKTLIALLYYVGAGLIIFGAILLAYLAYKNHYYTGIHNRGYAVLGIGLLLAGALGYFSLILSRIIFKKINI